METPQEEFKIAKNSYAAFDAISLRNLIISRLNDQGIFTDQNYIGSNLASIIDIISYSYNTLLFYLHKTSTESTFTEAQLYENISKIVKLLDYKPVGYQTSTLTFEASASEDLSNGTYTIPRYSSITVGGIPFSFNDDVTFVKSTFGTVELNDFSNKNLLYQGVFRETPLYVATGEPNEVCVINNPNSPIDHFNIHVYVKEKRTNKWLAYKEVPNIYGESYRSCVFEKRLNSNKIYEVIFGDGINGRKLEENDKIVIFYLQSSGQDGIIGPQTLVNTKGATTVYNSPLHSEILNDINVQGLNYISNAKLATLIFTNVVGSTLPREIESAESIRRNAPSNFKSQYRLVTKSDYETYIRTNFANFLSDVQVFDNWEYVANYLKYFQDVGVNAKNFSQILLNQTLYADSCNFNNIYICALPKVSQGSTLKYLLPAQKEIILSSVNSLKTLTSEIVFLDPIYKEVFLGLSVSENSISDDDELTRLRIVKSNQYKRTDKSILNDITNVFETFFDITSIRLGKIFDYSALVQGLVSIDGVKKIQTYNIDTNQVVDGLSLIMRNPSYPDDSRMNVRGNMLMNRFDVFYFRDIENLFLNLEIVDETIL